MTSVLIKLFLLPQKSGSWKYGKPTTTAVCTAVCKHEGYGLWDNVCCVPILFSALGASCYVPCELVLLINWLILTTKTS